MKRKKWILLIIICVVLTGLVHPEEKIVFDDFFKDATMRVDYYHLGDAQSEEMTIDEIYKQGQWAGSTINLINEFNNGRYYLKIYDVSSKALIYSKGFDSYFGEYKTTSKAASGKKRAYHESALFPYPKEKIKFVLEKRDKKNELKPLFSFEINPGSIDIIHEKVDPGIKVYTLHNSGDPHNKVDIAFIAEGYTFKEQEKVKSDFMRFKDVLFSYEPYKSRKEDFNVYGVFKPSAEKGCDEPRMGIFKNSVLSSSFNSLGSERYLLVEDNKSLRDIASAVPYDTLAVMINQKRYGGGGIYNLYCTFTTDNQWYRYLFLHEFGHSFAGLADEYYTSSVAYNEFYPKGIEPVEPNITALLNPNNPKWKDMLSSGIEIPTPWRKTSFDKMDEEYQQIRAEINQKISVMKRNGANPEDIKKIEEKSEYLSLNHAKKVDHFLNNSLFKGKVGIFEGAGYSSKGLFRSMIDCLMFTKGDKPFCKVCEKAVIRMIDYYSR